MPKIVISEVDKTLETATDVTENIVYVPGITLNEAEDIPTLFTSVSAFTDKFGKQPYKFAVAQEVSGTKIIGANEYEKSYIYALELLNAGIKVSFQNITCLKDFIKYNKVTDTSTIKDWGSGKYFTFSTTSDTVTESNYRDYLIKDNNIYKYAQSYNKVTYYKATNISSEPSATGTEVYTADDSGALAAFYIKLKGGSDKTSSYQVLLDKWTYNTKYITTGGYPTILNEQKSITEADSQSKTVITQDYSLLQTVAMVAAIRGDSISLIDTLYQEDVLTTFNNINNSITKKDLEETGNYYIKGAQSDKCNLKFTLDKKRKGESTLKYSTIIGPSGSYTIIDNILTSLDIATISMPGSFGYLLSLSNNINTYKNPDYLAIAGVIRGKVPNLIQLDTETTGAQADSVQVRDADKICINPIIKVQNYGYCIWGNRTLFPNLSTNDLSASSFLNIRVMCADAKKVTFAACQKLTFETNTTELWLKFKAEVEPTLEKMISNGALEDYELTKLVSDQKATLTANIKLVTEYAVEDFDITFNLTDSTVEASQKLA